jgi:heme d1 biosynthesis radical SAM protein NirJ
MLRVTSFMQEIVRPTPPGPKARLPGPVVIWNLIRRCNLTCRHCYSFSADADFPGELTTPQIRATMTDLWDAGVRMLVLSGGEPLLHPDIFEISRRAKSMGFHLALSTNGTLIDAGRLPAIVSIGYDYVGISLDGLQQTHDRFRRKPGAYEASLQAARLLRDARVRVGLRFTLTRENAHDLPALLDLIEREGIERFYLSHLNYAGRGNIHRDTDAQSRTTRAAMDLLFDTCWRLVEQGRPKEFVTGNNDADGVYLLQWLRRRFPDREEHLRAKLAQWGGNSSGVNVANIDNVGDVHPDSFWWDHTLGNVTRRRFGEIWADTGDPVMARLKASPRALGGRCGRCGYFDICGGNTRVRAMQLTGDPWAEDPGCYLQDDELCLEAT